MAYSLQKSTVATVVGLALVMTLAACSSDQRDNRQVSGDESYLKTAPLRPLTAPSGLILPVQTGTYEVPVITRKGDIGKQLDIRPPAQKLAVTTSGMDRPSVTGPTGTLDVQSGADDTGLPVVIVRAPYTMVWDRLPPALTALGMTVNDRSRSKGAVEVTYKPLSSSDWRTLGVTDPGLSAGDYKLQVGDLDNRTSLQFMDAKGKPLGQSQNDALVAAFQAAFSKTNSK
ncbi:hypothetical protein C9426_25105 [Serratia sp. S1B]|nr:hypothetical protein C9426_25105 [Serratia sp. S1B]